VARSTARAQHVFVNGRPVRDRTIQHAISEAYRGLIEPGKHPTAVLLVEMSPAGVDVNVHPTKTEVRFRDSSAVHQTVYRACRDALRARDLTPIWEWKKRESIEPVKKRVGSLLRRWRRSRRASR
jgi:DNA mismatch repair protein MutL